MEEVKSKEFTIGAEIVVEDWYGNKPKGRGFKEPYRSKVLDMPTDYTELILIDIGNGNTKYIQKSGCKIVDVDEEEAAANALAALKDGAIFGIGKIRKPRTKKIAE